MKKHVLLIVAMVMGAPVFAQTNTAALLADNAAGKQEAAYSLRGDDAADCALFASEKSYGGFTRGRGFVIRPELYRGVDISFGYQYNPYVQTYLCFGYSDGLEGALGVRAYTGDANWAAMFDLRFGLLEFVLPSATLVAGASFKDLDFGVGAKYYTDGYYYLIAPVITVGWNIRCYEHR